MIVDRNTYILVNGCGERGEERHEKHLRKSPKKNFLYNIQDNRKKSRDDPTIRGSLHKVTMFRFAVIEGMGRGGRSGILTAFKVEPRWC